MNKLLRLQNLVSSILVTTTVASGMAAPAAFAQEGTAPLNNNAAPDVPAPAESEETALERVVKRYSAVFKEVDAALFKADGYIAQGRTEEALALLSEAESALPDNVASVPFRDKIALIRQRAIEREAGVNASLEAEDMIDTARNRNRNAILMADRYIEEAKDHLKRMRLPEATAAASKAREVLPILPSTTAEQEEVNLLRAQISAAYFQRAVENRSPTEAESYLREVKNILGENHRFYVNLKNYYEDWRKTASAYNPYTLNAALERDERETATLLAKAKALYLYGDLQGALRFYDNVLLYDANNTEAKAGKLKITQILSNPAEYEHELTRSTLLNSTSNAWGMAKAFSVEERSTEMDPDLDPVKLKMDRLLINISLRGANLQGAIDTLNELAKSYDPTGRGLDIVISDGAAGLDALPPISLSLNRQPLSKVLDFILRRVGYSYDIRDGIVEVHPSMGNTNLIEVEIPSTNAFEKMKKSVNRSAASGSAPAATASDPWGGSSGASPWGGSGGAEVDDIDVPKLYFQKRGINFGEDGSITCDENVFTVVHADPKVIDKIRRTIQKLDEDSIKQVNIEAKFIEVSDTVLHEVTANWRMAKNGVVRAGTNNRGSMETHAVDSGTKQITLSRQNSVYEDENGNLITMEDAEPLSFSVPVPTLSNSLYYGPAGIANPSDVADGVFGSSVPSFVGKVGTLDDYDVYLLLNLLDAKAGADIMAAPSLTVETDQPAEIEIAQLINFPSSYDDPQMDVSSSGGWNNDSNWGGGSGGSVTIAPAVPQFDRTTSEEFEKVGIVLNVTPTVNADNSIKLTLDDLKIMEFEGFMDYGGTAVSMVGSTIVTMPMTYYQPVFNIRRVRTSVTIADGATMVIGGLMREEIKTVDDKVPILGDLPLIGAAFRGKSKAVQKKNLLVFITGNLMSRGGSTAISTFKGTSPAEIYSNPTFMSSAGVLYRESTRPAEESNAGANAASAAETPSSAGSL